MFEVRAPEIKGIKTWLNSKALRISDLKGKVVLVDFWTYTCINCLRTLPYLKEWHKKYSKKGLEIIGVHTPEFDFEKEVKNVQAQVDALKIKYPIALDNDRETWNSFDNHYWPAKFLITKEGYVDYVHFGEGDYEKIEQRIQEALGIKTKIKKEKYAGYMFDQTPETYVGYERNTGLGSGLVCGEDGCNIYIEPSEKEPGVIYPHGQWIQEKDYLELEKTPGKISYVFNAREVNIVVVPLEKKATLDIFVNKKRIKKIKNDTANMYNIFKNKKYAERELELIFNKKVRVYAFTFG